MKNFKGVIFDLDGTLLDSMKVWENVDRMFLEENGINPPSGISDTVKKMTIDKSAEYFKTRFSLEHSCEYIINRIEELAAWQYNNSIPLKDGAYETVTTLKSLGIRMCVATATYNSIVNSALKRLGIYDDFEFVMTCSDIGKGKDEPDIFLKAAEKLNCDINEVMVAEDSLHCIETAKSAGFFTVGVYDSTSDCDWQEICRLSDRAVMNIKEMTDIIKGEKQWQK